MDCRGHRRRIDIVSKYRVVPIAHLRLLNGQTKHSDAGATIENYYYIFELIDKKGNSEIITCGMEAASDFLKLISHNGLRVFDPLVTKKSELNRGCTSSNTDNSNNYNEVTVQLHNAIMWVISMIKRADSKSPIYRIKAENERHLHEEPPLSRIKAVNTIIQRCFKGETLTTQITKLRESNDIKNSVCEFSLVERKLLEKNILSFF